MGGGAPSIGDVARRDPATALLSLGLDDPDLIRNAHELVNMDIGTLKRSLQNVEEEVAPAADDEDDDEEAPPPPA